MQAHQGGCPDVLVLEAAGLVQRPSGAPPADLCAWDASDGARPDATADANPELPDAVAGKLADPEPGVPVLGGPLPRDDWRSVVRVEPAALCKPGADQSGEQSCAVPESADAEA